MRVGDFQLGQVVITPAAQDRLKTVDVIDALKRHARGDYGEVSDEDKQANVEALEYGGRLLSAYISNNTRFWIITEHDRSVTTILLPEDY